MNRLIQQDGRRTLVLVYQEIDVYKIYLKVQDQSLTLVGGQGGTKPESTLEQGGSSSSAGVGTGSAAIELGAADTAFRQTESEEHETQVLIVKTGPTSPPPQEFEAHQASGIRSCSAQQLVQTLCTSTWHRTSTSTECKKG